MESSGSPGRMREIDSSPVPFCAPRHGALLTACLRARPCRRLTPECHAVDPATPFARRTLRRGVLSHAGLRWLLIESGALSRPVNANGARRRTVQPWPPLPHQDLRARLASRCESRRSVEVRMNGTDRGTGARRAAVYASRWS
eukprot:364500-Chlamydomonas_euryale.AAC.38